MSDDPADGHSKHASSRGDRARDRRRGRGGACPRGRWSEPAPAPVMLPDMARTASSRAFRASTPPSKVMQWPHGCRLLNHRAPVLRYTLHDCLVHRRGASSIPAVSGRLPDRAQPCASRLGRIVEVAEGDLLHAAASAAQLLRALAARRLRCRRFSPAPKRTPSSSTTGRSGPTPPTMPRHSVCRPDSRVPPWSPASGSTLTHGSAGIDRPASTTLRCRAQQRFLAASGTTTPDLPPA